MNWITDQIAIGSYHEAQDRELLERESIRSILGLTAALTGKRPDDLGVERIEIVTLLDGPGNALSRFGSAVATLKQLASEMAPVLVHCRAGWSRSPAVVAAYLVVERGLTADEALAEVTTRRQCSMVPELRELVTQFHREHRLR